MVSNESFVLIEDKLGVPLDMSAGYDERLLLLERGHAERVGPGQLGHIQRYLSMLGGEKHQRETTRLRPIIHRLTQEWRHTSSRVRQRVDTALVSV